MGMSGDWIGIHWDFIGSHGVLMTREAGEAGSSMTCESWILADYAKKPDLGDSLKYLSWTSEYFSFSWQLGLGSVLSKKAIKARFQRNHYFSILFCIFCTLLLSHTKIRINWFIVVYLSLEPWEHRKRGTAEPRTPSSMFNRTARWSSRNISSSRSRTWQNMRRTPILPEKNLVYYLSSTYKLLNEENALLVSQPVGKGHLRRTWKFLIVHRPLLGESFAHRPKKTPTNSSRQNI